MTYAWYIVYLVGFGILATGLLGLAASWIDRKVTARVQYRVGPAPFQPVYDLVKLLGKETLIPAGASAVAFLGAPLLGLASVVVVATLLWVSTLWPAEGFLGDIIVALYLLLIPSLSIVLGGVASANPYASLGASREMKLILAYEPPFVMAAFVAVIQADYALLLGDIVTAQAEGGAFLASASGFLAFVVALLCIQAKLALVPFDVAEAETEIVAGPLVEYSGAPLAAYRLMKHMLLFVLPFFLIILFLGGFRLEGAGWAWSIVKYVVVLTLVVVIRNTNPRVRIDQAVRFFWGPLSLAGLAALGLAMLGW
jgi:NADH-quinone oxidoreductase subunit H